MGDNLLTRMKIMNRLLFGFSLVLVATLFLGGVGIRSIDNLARITADIFRHPFTVTHTILDIKAELLLNQRLVTQLVHNGDPGEVAHFQQGLAERMALVDRKMALVRERFLGPASDVDDIERALARWRAARAETLELMRAGRIAEAIAMNDGRDALIAEEVFRAVEDVRTFAANKAARFKELAESERAGMTRAILLTLALILVGGIGVTVFITRSVGQSLRQAVGEVQRVIEGSAEKARVVEAISEGDYSQEIGPVPSVKPDMRQWPDDELGALLRAASRLSEVQGALDQSLQKMTRFLRRSREAERAADWLKSGLNGLYTRLRGELDPATFENKALQYMVEYLGAGVGTLYVRDEETDELCLAAAYALPPEQRGRERIRLGEGVIGQAIREKRPLFLKAVPADYLPIASSLGQGTPRLIAAVPLLHGDHLVGAMEIGAFREFTDVELEFLEHGREAIAVKLRMVLSRQRMAELLEETRQQEELLRVQQEELQQSNEELEERALLLEQQRESIRAKNEEIERTSESLRQKAAELERVSAYKSQFLANMSHELRTPLNSMMILSGLLMQNREGNLTDKQVEYAATIHSAGTDLLNLINDILDLFKVEAGQLQLNCVDIHVDDLLDSLHALFAPLAEKKGLDLAVEAESGVPSRFLGDERRVLQILRNLLANAIKFTRQGRVELRISVPAAKDNPLPAPALAFAVRDTGIGIAPAHQQLVFEAFRQADGTISRQYGGTGLGLSISLQLARRMQGDIRLESREGEGSVFTLYLPILAMSGQGAPAAVPAEAPLPDDRHTLKAGDRNIPVVEDNPDIRAAMDKEAALEGRKVLLVDDDMRNIFSVSAVLEEKNMVVIEASNGREALARLEEHPDISLVLMDIMMPEMDGYAAMARIRRDPRFTDLPIIAMTAKALKGDQEKCMAAGASDYIAKPVDIRKLLSLIRVWLFQVA